MAEEMKVVMRYSPLAIRRIIRSHWRAVPKEPVHLIGEPSTVKSEMVYQESKRLSESEQREFFDWNRSTLVEKKEAVEHPEKYFIFADLRASETDIGELRLQDLKAEQAFIVFRYNILFEALSKKEARGVLFFDEMNLAANMIKAQFYKIINDRCIGDIPISQGVLCVSAGNEAEQSRNVTENPVPLVLRRANYLIRPLTSDEYLEYAMQVGQHQWVTGYIAFQPQEVNNLRYDLMESTGQPCARTWTKLSNVLKANDDLPMEDVQMHAIGFVGQASGLKFSAYAKTARAIDLNAVMENPERINDFMGAGDLSIAYAIVTGVVEKYRTDKKNIVPALKIANAINKMELGAYLMRSMKALDEDKFKKTIKDEKIVDTKLFDKIAERYARFLIKQG